MDSHFKNKSILLTGGYGFLGSFVKEKLESEGADDIFIPRSKNYDLREKETCLELTKDKDLVIHLAAKVGGIGYNLEHPGELIYDNAMMNLNILEASRKNKVQKFLGVGSVCGYPKFTPVPFKEDDFFNGYPEETNAPYGIAKRILLVQSQAYRKQYDFNSVYLIPVNLYGPGDNFDLHSSHVIPALIRKFSFAKENNESSVTLWGTGSASREFLYVKDAANAIVLALEKYNKDLPVNLGTGTEVKIKNLAEMIKKEINYDGQIEWDSTKPDGQPRRCLDTSRAKKEFGFTAQFSLSKGLSETITWWNEKGKKIWTD